MQSESQTAPSGCAAFLLETFKFFPLLTKPLGFAGVQVPVRAVSLCVCVCACVLARMSVCVCVCAKMWGHTMY